MGIVEQPIHLSKQSRTPTTGLPVPGLAQRVLPNYTTVPAHNQECLHMTCSRCHGTGDTGFGACIHMMSCPCPMCTVRC